MAELIQQFKKPVARGEASYLVRVYGEPRRDGSWTGWLEFHPLLDTHPVLRTEPETRQPDRGSLAHWASGLETYYFEHAIERARQQV